MSHFLYTLPFDPTPRDDTVLARLRNRPDMQLIVKEPKIAVLYQFWINKSSIKYSAIPCPEKWNHSIFASNFAECWPIFKTFTSRLSNKFPGKLL